MIDFWKKKTVLNYLLIPVSVLWSLITQIRLKSKSKKIANTFVICVGNIVVGGSGKTPFTIYLARKLKEKGFKVGILSRGYKSKINKTPTAVNPQKHTANEVGDEALLLSQAAQVVISKDRYKGAKLLQNIGCNVIIMDDGLQNPSLQKDFAFLMFDSYSSLGNNLIMPAGPLRERFKQASKRVNWVIKSGSNNTPYLDKLIQKYKLKFCEVNIIPKSISSAENNKNVLAFAGIGNPNKFFISLNKAGYNVVITKQYKDHYSYTNNDIEKLLQLAQSNNLQLITTSKDYVKIDSKYKPFVQEFKIELNLSKECEANLLNTLCEKISHKLNS